jgi:hypothetical protein
MVMMTESQAHAKINSAFRKILYDSLLDWIVSSGACCVGKEMEGIWNGTMSRLMKANETGLLLLDTVF